MSPEKLQQALNLSKRINNYKSMRDALQKLATITDEAPDGYVKVVSGNGVTELKGDNQVVFTGQENRLKDDLIEMLNSKIVIFEREFEAL